MPPEINTECKLPVEPEMSAGENSLMKIGIITEFKPRQTPESNLDKINEKNPGKKQNNVDIIEKISVKISECLLPSLIRDEE